MHTTTLSFPAADRGRRTPYTTHERRMRRDSFDESTFRKTAMRARQHRQISGHLFLRTPQRHSFSPHQVNALVRALVGQRHRYPRLGGHPSRGRGRRRLPKPSGNKPSDDNHGQACAWTTGSTPGSIENGDQANECVAFSPRSLQILPNANGSNYHRRYTRASVERLPRNAELTENPRARVGGHRAPDGRDHGARGGAHGNRQDASREL